MSGGAAWLGADPGGAGRFGVAILRSDGSWKAWCVGCADEAVETANTNLDLTPAGLGVDAPLWWSSGPSGDRRADQWLRQTSGAPSSVQASNSLRGAALTQGAMMVHRARGRFPDIGVTEAHPKALMKTLGLKTWAQISQMFNLTGMVVPKTEDERDAVVAAIAAREGFEGRWTVDLSLDRLPSELDPASYWLGPVHYFWPET